ncbi:endonuclease MutS2 [Moheibacter sediminis]|uniref:DNA mismatch repair protein MutS2 n=1 Tax=Moheibacter sediminis TaxID=1434700 RepID=A0A1W1Z3D6_9FLAO|nr:DNA mismatch repair protein MutS [Moheibacter sediminis]SMC42997.1 DNA mismatch repair protein MutS2 [Moheibacter sediminis]
MQVSEQTLHDLEFPKILENIAQFAFNERTSELILNLKPYENKEQLIIDLKTTNEYLTSIESENKIPFSEFYYMKDFLPRLEIENYYLSVEEFFKIKSNALQIKEITKFILQFEEYFPKLQKIVSEVIFEKTIVTEIDSVFNKHGEIKDDASPELHSIRKKSKLLGGKITELFNKSMTANLAFLDDIRESVFDDRRVLAVNSAMRKRVKGRFLGTSKTGSISFIEPESVQKPQRELDELKEEEKKEIIKILKDLTIKIAVYKPLLEEYEELLEYMDFTQAKAEFSLLTKACLPEITSEKGLELINAYHPLLYLSHQQKKIKTFPQTLKLDKNQRIIIISGPNAGGKSITLKTIGLNQLMIQSGILIPVHEKSKIGFFDKIFTDIGDNQSIENQLSTYSYRLKQMSYFIRNVDENSLLLVDEFGTGSDPELGGALAEVFFEEFYERNAYGIFTTHYTNIKLVAEELPEAINACMLFDEKTLTPLYQLEVGQSGSSFTFEVAEKNKIPFRLINRAKKKVEQDKVRLDKTILKLQQEKFHIQKTKNEVDELKISSEEQTKELEFTQEKIQQKLVDFQQVYDNELKTLQVGRKMNELADSYLKSKNKKVLVSQFLKWVEMENSKKTPINSIEKKKEKIIQKEIQKELKHNTESIKEKQLQIEENKEKEIKQSIENLKIGDRVKLKDSQSVGTIEEIKGKRLTINYGHFTAKVSIFEINKV